MTIISWVILGLLAGAIAKTIVPGYQGGNWLATMFLGIIGSFIGGTLHLFIETGTLELTASDLSVMGVFVAVLGAIVAIYLYGTMSRRRL